MKTAHSGTKPAATAAAWLMLSLAAGCTRSPATVAQPTPPQPLKTDLAGTASRGAVTGPPSKAASEGAPLAFVFVGDTGVGTAEERAVASAMAAHCKAAGCDLALHLGDIIYPNGIASATDPLLTTNLEEPFADLGVPLYLVLGNHDYRGNPDAWIEAYEPGQRAARRGAIDGRIPARYYTFTAGEARFVALDTNRLDAAQARWLDAVLLESRRAGERWVIVFGHHPWISYGRHGHAKPGDAAFYARHLCNRVDFFLAGHDHDKQVLEPHCGVHAIVSGAGSMLRPTRQGPRSRFARSSLGFSRLSLHGDVAELSIYDTRGRLEYQRRIERAPAALPRVADGLCAERSDDPDCVDAVCVRDGRCDPSCALDADCAASGPTPCPCDSRPGVCELRGQRLRCGCDPACAAGVQPCISDGLCDPHCGGDPDCRP